jgi:hypothetical protein
MEQLLILRKPLEEAMDRNDWKKACELFVEKIKLAKQMVDLARRYGSQSDVNNCVRRVELYRETYSQVDSRSFAPFRFRHDLARRPSMPGRCFSMRRPTAR